ncbi:hypothetical protein CGLAUT_01545 [Corynebacterium glaucum]|uniref:hypothetical protein n=1 Tax=Corynebacterium glaucum TaxID=187491 RepID=UPI0025B30B39|nr:hypothetical protein [Corynebacterium glaucum]WJZ06819.1 hypothetical protein CGLAUT_01545 [Corynebacterium glaucum]
MKKLIATAVAVAATLALVTPASAATLTPETDQNGGLQCRITLTEPERVGAQKAEAAAKTLTLAGHEVARAEALEAAYPGAKAHGDAYVDDPNVRQFLNDDRTLALGQASGSKSTPETLAGKDRAREAAKTKLVSVGMHPTTADNYLDSKQGTQIQDQAYLKQMPLSAQYVIGIDRGYLRHSKRDGVVVGNTGETVARGLPIDEPQRTAFVFHFNNTYYGRAINELERGYADLLTTAPSECHKGLGELYFPADFVVPEPEATQPAPPKHPVLAMFETWFKALGSLIESLIPGAKLPVTLSSS